MVETDYELQDVGNDEPFDDREDVRPAIPKKSVEAFTYAGRVASTAGPGSAGSTLTFKTQRGTVVPHKARVGGADWRSLAVAAVLAIVPSGTTRLGQRRVARRHTEHIWARADQSPVDAGQRRAHY